jgi:hypothetical protein
LQLDFLERKLADVGGFISLVRKSKLWFDSYFRVIWWRICWCPFISVFVVRTFKNRAGSLNLIVGASKSFLKGTKSIIR